MKNNRRRFLYYLEQFNKIIIKSIESYKSNPTINPVEILYKNNARSLLFQLEGLARIEKKIGINKKYCDDLLIEYKAIEDALGKFDYYFDILEKSKIWNIDYKIEEYLKQQLFIQIGLTEQILIKYKWIKKNKENKYDYIKKGYLNNKKKISKLKVFNQKEELNLFLNLFIKEMNSIHKKVKHNKFNYNNLEEGIHEFRRRLRWIGIYSSALNGKVIIDKYSKNNFLNRYVTNKNEKNKFNTLPINNEISYRLKFLQGGYYAMSELISKIGVIKDKGLISDEIIKIVNWLNIPKSTIIKNMKQEYKSLSNVKKEAKKLIEFYIIKEKTLLYIINHFKKQFV